MIVVLGTNANGGIKGVIDDHVSSTLYSNVEVTRVITHAGKSKFGDLILFIRSIFILVWFLCFSNVKIIHAHMSYNGSFWRKFIFFLISTPFRAKFICHLHGSEFKVYFEKSNVLRKALIVFYIKNVAEFIVLSSGWSAYIHSISGRKATVINNYVDIPEKYQSSMNKSSDFIFIGAFIERKGVIELIEAFSSMENESVLHLCGDGILSSIILEKINELKLNDRVVLHGWIGFHEKLELLSRCKFFVLPSHNEGLPLTIIEAMACKTLIISTDVGAIPEVISNNHNGYITKPSNIKELTNVLHKAFNLDDANFEKITNYAHSDYIQNYTSYIVLPKLKELYKRAGCDL